MVQIAKYGKRAQDILFYLYDHGEVPLTYLNNIIKSTHTYYRVIKLFEADGIVKSRERIHNRKYILISLTDKGKALAESLKETEQKFLDESYTIPQNFHDRFKNLSAHSNTLDDHVAIHEINYDSKGHDRVVFVYVKLNGNNIMRLWCEVDQTYECIHTQYAWTLPDVQEIVEIQYLQVNINRENQNGN